MELVEVCDAERTSLEHERESVRELRLQVRARPAHTFTIDQSDVGSVSIFSRWTNQTWEAWYILTMDQSDVGSGVFSQWTNQT
eukprot:240782-Prorocentrum_minimum.AAC.1